MFGKKLFQITFDERNLTTGQWEEWSSLVKSRHRLLAMFKFGIQCYIEPRDLDLKTLDVREVEIEE